MTTLLNTLFSERGELFVIGHGRRVLFARCKPEIRIYEKTAQVPLLGESGCKKKSMRFTIALCGDMEFTHEPEDEPERYELTADILRNDGIAERFYFHNISLLEIDSSGGWEFELNVTGEQIRKLSIIAGL
ncbi:MAG: hypothetical protein K2P42_18465 [Lachnospiraceae bacterium]|nr:hypothetical protein [Lachnospiraceae bacterium]MDE6999440.1 hypothetical protein [Lachnospiraceae bacterium]